MLNSALHDVIPTILRRSERVWVSIAGREVAVAARDAGIVRAAAQVAKSHHLRDVQLQDTKPLLSIISVLVATEKDARAFAFDIEKRARDAGHGCQINFEGLTLKEAERYGQGYAGMD